MSRRGSCLKREASPDLYEIAGLSYRGHPRVLKAPHQHLGPEAGFGRRRPGADIVHEQRAPCACTHGGGAAVSRSCCATTTNLGRALASACAALPARVGRVAAAAGWFETTERGSGGAVEHTKDRQWRRGGTTKKMRRPRVRAPRSVPLPAPPRLASSGGHTWESVARSETHARITKTACRPMLSPRAAVTALLLRRWESALGAALALLLGAAAAAAALGVSVGGSSFKQLLGVSTAVAHGSATAAVSRAGPCA